MDVTSYHDYGHDGEPIPGPLQESLAQAGMNGKPLIVGETKATETQLALALEEASAYSDAFVTAGNPVLAAGIAGEKKVTMWLQNWTSESFDPLADYALDWSAHFDRSTRKVPSSETWNKQLIPELEALQHHRRWRRPRDARNPDCLRE